MRERKDYICKKYMQRDIKKNIDTHRERKKGLHVLGVNRNSKEKKEKRMRYGDR